MLSTKEIEMLQENVPFFNKLLPNEKELIINGAIYKTLLKGQHLYHGDKECAGLVIVLDGQLRAYIISDNAKEITLYRLLDRDVCIMTASCMLKNINIDIHIEIEKDSTVIVIPTNIYDNINNSNSSVKEFTLSLVSSRFTDVMWVLEQLVFSSQGKRLANFLIEQTTLENSNILNMTHEFIANDLGTAREVITRLLKYFQSDELVSLSRGSIEVINIEKLNQLV